MAARVGESNPRAATPQVDQVAGVPPDSQNAVAHTYLVAAEALKWLRAQSKTQLMSVGPSFGLCVGCPPHELVKASVIPSTR